MTPTHPSLFGVRARAAAALSALTLAALSLSGCGALIQAGQNATSSNSTATGSGNFEKDAEKAIKELENSTSEAYGTEGMAPLKSIAPVIESAAYDLGADPAKDERWKKFY
ncbi:MAG: hypothetical protein E6719_06245, partial [Dermabacter sp.]|nr:hypothetical protein [Dermabacter sp.]